MQSAARCIGSALLISLTTGACASVDPQKSFESAADVVTRRTGLETGWPRDEDARAAIEQRVEELLAEPLTAETAAQVALLANPTLQARLEELGIAQADLAQATRLPNPGFEIAYQEPDEGGGSKVEWTLVEDVLGAVLTPLRRRVAEQELERVKLEAGQAMLDLVADTRIGFYHYQAAVQLVDRLTLIRDLAEAAAELARRQRKAGTASELDALQQEALHTDASVRLIEARAEAAVTREAVERLLGLAPSATSWEPVRELPALPQRDPATEDLERFAVEHRLDLAAGRYAVDAVGRALAHRRGTRWFPAGIKLGVTREDELDDTRLTGPVLEVELPLFDTGAASVARLDAFHRRARAQLGALVVNARSEVREARERLLAARQATETYRDVLLPQRWRILDETQRRYNMMLEGVYELIQARQLHLETEQRYVESWGDYWIARTDLDRAVGGRLPAAPETHAAPEAPAAEADAPLRQQPHEHPQGSQHEHHGDSP